MQDKGTVIRTIFFILAWLNTYAANQGFYHLPHISEEGVSIFIAFVVSCWTYWKHQYNTRKALSAKKLVEKSNYIDKLSK